MNFLRLVLDSLRFHWRMHAGAAAGTALAAAILTGALLVGDSTDYSLRRYALARLGGIHFAIESRGGFFSQALVDDLQGTIPAPIVPALTLRGMAVAGEVEQSKQINQVSVVGISPEFWDFDPDVAPSLGEYETALNERLAHALGVQEGERVALRIIKPGILPRDAPLSSRAEDTSTRALCTVKAVLPDTGLGRFSLTASQAAPYNAFIDLAWLQEQTGLNGRVDLALVGQGTPQEEVREALRKVWRPRYVGLRLETHPSGIIQLETDRIFLRNAVAEAALSLPEARGTLSYLVNSIAKGNRSTPYSFATAGPVPDNMPDDHMIINQWLADEIHASKDDTIEVRYYELTPSNDFVEKTRRFTVHSIVKLADLETERDLMPEFPGLTDVERCQDWDIGMPMEDEKLADEANEYYWNQYGPTPKFLCTLAAGQTMWANRFGKFMTVRFPADVVAEKTIRDTLREQVAPDEVGLFVIPVREQAFEAVQQAIDLGGLFLGMSFFLIVASLILTALLFVFGVQQRASEMGVLLAMGFRPRHIRALFLTEASASAILGAGVGAAASTVYTRILIYGLSHYWQGAVAHTHILYYAAPGTVFTGGAVSLVCALGAMAIAMWRQTRHRPRELLTMDFSQEIARTTPKRRRTLRLWPPVTGSFVAIGLSAYALAANVAEVALVFFGAGALLLLSGVGLLRYLLGRMTSQGSVDHLTFTSLSLENASRRRGRSLSVAALLATGSFLVLAVSSMQHDITAHADKRFAGTGGFELFAETTVPLTENPAKALDEPGVKIVTLRVYDGDDASCLNLNRAQTPRILGVNADKLSQLGAFTRKNRQDGLWEKLRLDLPEGAVPALVGDSDTAMWGLQKKTGVEDGDTLHYRDEAGNKVDVKLVGTLPMRLSVFQGTILISDKWFTRLFPSEDGFRMFLIDTPPEEQESVADRLNAEFEKEGMNAVSTVERLRRFYTVESTYLAMFLVLGGLGMILGSAALGIVVLRNLLERRREIAMLRAVGFQSSALFRLFFVEYAFLLGIGVLIGGIAAAIAMTPTVTSAGSSVSIGLQTMILAGIAATGLVCIVLAIRIGLGRENFDALRTE
ncbi:MAG: FtsX-like permease family protein [Candidatus Hydrogenedentota bacterium]